MGMWLQGVSINSVGSWQLHRTREHLPVIQRREIYISSNSISFFDPAQTASQTSWTLNGMSIKRPQGICVFDEVLSVNFFLRTQMNSGQGDSHSKCTLWTGCLREAKLFPNPDPSTQSNTQVHTLLGYTPPAIAHFPHLLLHIKNAVLLSLTAHAAKATKPWGWPADTP